jgi:hypothetical protein
VRVRYRTNGRVPKPIEVAQQRERLFSRRTKSPEQPSRQTDVNKGRVRRTRCRLSEQRVEHFGRAAEGVTQSGGDDGGMVGFARVDEVAAQEVVCLYGRRGRFEYMAQASADDWQGVGHRIKLDFI